jgi:protein-S-isoprenylcysteine O-methyltransferase Ste14
MVTTALLLDVGFFLLALVLRSVVQWRRTGDPGWRLGGPRTAAGLLAHTSIVLGVVALMAAPWVASESARDAAWTVSGMVGAALGALGLALVVAAQFGLGSSWRIGVDPAERTDLVTDGLYRWIRNPIFTGMLAWAVAIALLVPGPLAFVGAALLVLAVEVQVRAVEEPYLRGAHGERYRRWTARTGRFVPGVGCTA